VSSISTRRSSKRAVVSGLGVAVLPALAVESAGVRGGVAVRGTANGDRRTLHLVTARGGRGVPAVAVAAESLARLVAGRDGAAGAGAAGRTIEGDA
jgi:DNA-binding transcriptional LysR family regulator